ncbi:hypothetical protein TNIN_153351 [Trichonephila inaurata madagascariensis]|uniref:Uncharacterized protein n=1 Tax=Trichonephila inaurata madagascariensis TaxID=2747483 RepID=A0A8X7CBD8_9ARAC|nr:hypothetical protein TNIN_153351 [Trichonephila inaurata madagascariensis]
MLLAGQTRYPPSSTPRGGFPSLFPSSLYIKPGPLAFVSRPEEGPFSSLVCRFRKKERGAQREKRRETEPPGKGVRGVPKWVVSRRAGGSPSAVRPAGDGRPSGKHDEKTLHGALRGGGGPWGRNWGYPPAGGPEPPTTT